MSQEITKTVNPFEQLKHVDEQGNEYWLAREMQIALEYSSWQRFEGVLKRAILACKNSGHLPRNHFNTQVKMVDIAYGVKRELDDYKCSRYACYLLAMNSDPFKVSVSLAQTYFAIQTRKAELLEEMIKKLGLSQEEIDVALQLFVQTKNNFPDVKDPKSLITLTLDLLEDAKQIEESK